MILSQQRIMVTGGSGFLGQHLVAALRQRGLTTQPIADTPAIAPGIYTPRSSQFDLTDLQAVRELLRLTRPQLVIHLAALCGGIGANRARPADFCYHNLLMGAHLMDYSARAGVQKYVSIGTVCSYPANTPAPFREETLWDGYPEPTNAAYGLAKKMQLVQGQAYRQQYGLDAIHLLPVNLYGPHDNFDPANSHVIPALIRKFTQAKRQGLPEVQCWGSGQATREFLYAADCANGIVLAAQHYSSPDPVNLGSGQEISIRELADLIARELNYEGTICWDHTQPDGQLRRQLDCSRALQFGFQASTGLRQGLRQTIDWYHKEHPDGCAG